MKKFILFFFAFLLTFGATAQAQSRSELTDILEKFCQTYYKEAFNKTYHNGSLEITTIEVLDEDKGIILVNGKHSYKATINHYKQPFKAEISETKLGLKISFYKWYEADFFAAGHWEGPFTKTIIP